MRSVALGLLAASALAGCNGLLGVEALPYSPDGSAPTNETEAGLTSDGGQDATLPPSSEGGSGDDTSEDSPSQGTDGNPIGTRDAGPDGDAALPPPPACTGTCETLAFQMSFLGGASASVSVTPAGETLCNGPCTTSASFPEGTSVTLTADVAAGNIFHWTGACTGSSPTCTVAMSASNNLALVVSHYNYMFLSSTSHDGNLGGLTGADQICQTAATNANLPGTYQALLATGSTSLTTRLTAVGARGWIRTDGQPFADQPGDLTSGAIRTPPNLNESAQLVYQGEAWTGANGTGGPSGSDCTGFTSNASTGLSAWGNDQAMEQIWYEGTYAPTLVGDESEPCSSAIALYCFGTNLSNPLVYAKTAGRIAFLSTANFDTSKGLSGGTTGITTGSADVLCQTEAAAAGLSGTYLALLATTTASPASRFDTTGAPWVRPDGMPLAATAAAFMQPGAPALLTSLTQHANGTYADDVSYTRTGQYGYPDGDGAAPTDPLTSPASGPDDTCNDWTTGASTATSSLGWTAQVTLQYFDYRGGSVGTAAGFPTACGATLPIYCLQK